VQHLLFHDHIRFCVLLWVVNGHGYFQGVMVDPVMAILNHRMHAPRMAQFIGPGIFVKAGGVDHKCIVIDP
jgi:hypothetical protein